VLGPQASPPARDQPDQQQLLSHSMTCSWFLSARAGGDACGPSTMVVDYFTAFYREVFLIALTDP